ncbi:MAG TPA: dATP/dGTP pyrophosphohydrolase domain-containing protein [Chloroflexia bacterium]|jgi:hypothetical protein
MANRTMDEWQHVIDTWADATFDQDEWGILNHLKLKVEELEHAMKNPALKKPSIEAADCAILLFALAGYMGFNLQSAIEAKHDVNLSRKWGPKNALGVIEHVRALGEE